jgi:two-component system OmpR family response regulator
MAVAHAAREAPDLVVLDIGMPEMDGFEVCRRIRNTSNVPIIFLTAQDDEVDRILGFELGADDYVTKPFSPRELVARVRAVLKRSTMQNVEAALNLGELSLDADAHSCRVGLHDVALTSTEFALLSTLVRHPKQVRTRAQLIDAIWGATSQISDRTRDRHLRNIRAKLGTAGLKDAIETVHGIGIRMRGKTP